jgi:hypothetical protein
MARMRQASAARRRPDLRRPLVLPARSERRRAAAGVATRPRALLRARDRSAWRRATAGRRSRSQRQALWAKRSI